MDAAGNIYELEHVDPSEMLDAQREMLETQREDVARLEGYLRSRAESDRPDHEAELARVHEERRRLEQRRAR